ncbi:MAG: DnaJ domain-containing protein [Alphaproteobacteria bacterium]|nr:DnaJ domain-containing protein [Alphaproteobacteria bacterium]
MPYVFLGAIALILIILAINWSANAQPADVRRVGRYVLGFLMVAGAILLAARGQFGLAGPLAAASLLVFTGRRIPFLSSSKKSPGQASQVETSYLRVRLDHDSGEMDGEVLDGRFQGRQLSSLSEEELLELLEDLHSADPEGDRLLRAYIDRHYPGATGSTGAGAHQDEASAGAGGGSGPMTRKEALEILGLEDGASEREVKDAHRRLMKKFHPDQGGSAYFATRINQAKDLLLKG